MGQKIDISKLVDQILLNIGSINCSGLYTGKAGLALALFEASRYLNDENIENEAFQLLQESLVTENHDLSFENGLSGIGYVLLYLIENKFIDADFDEIFGKQYEQIMKDVITIRNNPAQLLVSLKIIYFLSIARRTNIEVKRIDEIIKAIFEGVELYLSMQFFDWNDVYYVKCFVGGSFYFNHSGNFLGQYGSGNDIIIANSILHSGIPLSIAPPETVGEVLTTIAGTIGISGNIGLTYENLVYASHENGQVYVNYNGGLISNNNYYDIVSVLHHEHYHQMTAGYSGGWLQNEYLAFIYQINDSSFQYASDWLRDYTMTNYYNLHYGQSYY